MEEIMKRILIWIVVCICVQALYAQEKSGKVHLELGYVLTSGNSNTQTLSGKADVKHEGEKNRLFFLSTYLRSENDGRKEANRFTAAARYERVFSGRLFGFIGSDYLIDRFSGYAHRISIGPGLGFDILKSDVHALKGLVSGMYIFEDYSVPDVDSDGFGSIEFKLYYEWTVRSNVTLKTQGSYSASLENMNKYYLYGEAAVEVSISDRLSLGIGYRINYQNLAPGPDIEKTDMSFMTSLIVNL